MRARTCHIHPEEANPYQIALLNQLTQIFPHISEFKANKLYFLGLESSQQTFVKLAAAYIPPTIKAAQKIALETKHSLKQATDMQAQFSIIQRGLNQINESPAAFKVFFDHLEIRLFDQLTKRNDILEKLNQILNTHHYQIYLLKQMHAKAKDHLRLLERVRPFDQSAQKERETLILTYQNLIQEINLLLNTITNSDKNFDSLNKINQEIATKLTFFQPRFIKQTQDFIANPISFNPNDCTLRQAELLKLICAEVKENGKVWAEAHHVFVICVPDQEHANCTRLKRVMLTERFNIDAIHPHTHAQQIIHRIKHKIQNLKLSYRTIATEQIKAILSSELDQIESVELLNEVCQLFPIKELAGIKFNNADELKQAILIHIQKFVDLQLSLIKLQYQINLFKQKLNDPDSQIEASQFDEYKAKADLLSKKINYFCDSPHLIYLDEIANFQVTGEQYTADVKSLMAHYQNYLLIKKTNASHPFSYEVFEKNRLAQMQTCGLARDVYLQVIKECNDESRLAFQQLIEAINDTFPPFDLAIHFFDNLNSYNSFVMLNVEKFHARIHHLIEMLIRKKIAELNQASQSLTDCMQYLEGKQYQTNRYEALFTWFKHILDENTKFIRQHQECDFANLPKIILQFNEQILKIHEAVIAIQNVIHQPEFTDLSLHLLSKTLDHSIEKFAKLPDELSQTKVKILQVLLKNIDQIEDKNRAQKLINQAEKLKNEGQFLKKIDKHLGFFGGPIEVEIREVIKAKTPSFTR